MLGRWRVFRGDLPWEETTPSSEGVMGESSLLFSTLLSSTGDRVLLHVCGASCSSDWSKLLHVCGASCSSDCSGLLQACDSSCPGYFSMNSAPANSSNIFSTDSRSSLSRHASSPTSGKIPYWSDAMTQMSGSIFPARSLNLKNSMLSINARWSFIHGGRRSR